MISNLIQISKILSHWEWDATTALKAWWETSASQIFGVCWPIIGFILRRGSYIKMNILSYVLQPSWSYGSWIYNHLGNQCLSPLTKWFQILLSWGVFDTTLCDKVCQWLARGRWFSQGTPVSSTNKTDPHDIAEIFLKVAVNTIALTLSLKTLRDSKTWYINDGVGCHQWIRIFFTPGLLSEISVTPI